MKIAYILVSSMAVLFLIYAIHAYLTFEVNLQEVKEAVSLRNEAQANNIMQGLDKFIDERIKDIRNISNSKRILDILSDSNREFSQIKDLESFLEQKESEIEFGQPNTTSDEIEEGELSKNLRDTITFYKDTYGYDVVEELFVTNRYGANIAWSAGKSDYVQSDEEWWQATKDRGAYVGKLEKQDYQRYSIPLAFRISNEQGDLLGVMRVVVSIDAILHEFVGEAEVIEAAGKQVILLDENDRIIYSSGTKFESSSQPVAYFDKIVADNGHFELPNGIEESTFVSYSRSIGYGDFQGFGWTSVIEQSRSSLVTEFLDQRNSILFVSVLGMVASIIIGILVSFSVSRPLQKLSDMASRLSQGSFEIQIKKSRIYEIGVIDESFNDMARSLRKLIETERELVKTRIRVKNERLIAIGQLAASMAHDLKNPLATIRSSAEIIKRNSKTDDNELTEVIARMDRAIDRIAHQIEDVLNFVRTTPLDISDVSMQSVFQSSIKSLEIPQNISIELPRIDFTIRGDFRKLEVVFINLILNAVQAIGKDQGKIIIRMIKENGDLKINVEDTGPGIPNKIFPKIFDPLITTKERGTGLGLSTCKNIIEQHGGTISAKNTPTTFIMRLPENVI